VRSAGLFSHPGAAGARGAHAVGGALAQGARHLLAAPSDGVHSEASDASDVLGAAMAKTARFKRGIPAPLLCIEARQEPVHLALQRLVRLARVALAMRTLALLDAGRWHGLLPGHRFSLSRVIVDALVAR
jgi:hypothetical protein